MTSSPPRRIEPLSPWLQSSFTQILMVAMITYGHLATVAKAIDIHGGVKMGIKNQECDDGKTGIAVDWDGKDKIPYTCPENYPLQPIPPGSTPAFEINEVKTGQPLHKCLKDKITYPELPLSGSHRPLWPVYGEYTYVPPQRWVHSLEHGSVVFVYHPCAQDIEIEKFRQLVNKCLWKHIITPNLRLDIERPYRLVTWGHALLMDHFDEEVAREWMKKYGMTAPEWNNFNDGQYNAGLLKKSDKVNNFVGTHSRATKHPLVCAEYEKKVGLF